MYAPLHCIALLKIRYSDTKSLLKAWSRENGLLTLLMSESGREGIRRRALTMPLSMFEGQCDIRPTKDIQSVRDLSATITPGASGTYRPFSAFMASVLTPVLAHAEADTALDSFLRLAIGAYNLAPSADGPKYLLYMLYGLTRHLGVEPDTSPAASGAEYFDLREGVFRHSRPLHEDFIAVPESRIVVVLDRMTLKNIGKVRLSDDECHKIYSRICDYYRIHLSINSLPAWPEWF